ncbi:choline-phosphate cytidylyltransferase [Friedmanniomyces endolithicus]|uniref:choline-phosphate cytidylyltransferase n=1 Tax=Rachicladosporium monterosium TaxID=1507873 RepID=A0ABR0LFL2_9PEZI|nr:choline-phosphate cytidylyltransferase [Friedmanniomyces endolithicus]KAK5148032.1 choline-phosphate cytidylyltransferase [Rachicladosporium monterosium]
MAPKRKRAEPASDEPAPDASSDGATDTPQAAEAEVKSLDPPAKRTRSAKVEATIGGEPEPPRGRARAGSKVEMPANGAEEGAGENGEAGTMRMAPPPPAGSVDPKGYKTNPPPQGRSVRVYADGVFDMFHLGHMRVLQQAKTAFPDTYLIVGVTGEAETHKRKGLTVMSAKERAESLRHCRWVDEVIEDCPWIINMAFLEKNHIDYVAHDDEPYGASEGDDIYKPIKERGMFLVTQRTEGVSTTGIITKIVRDYEQYVSRQLKRGTKRQELNISWLKKNELDIKRNVAELRDTIRQNWTTTGQERDGKGADFMAGYAMGLVGSVKGWMEASRRRNLSDSRPESPNGSESEDSGNKSPVGEIGSSRRGRQGQMEKEKEKDGASVQLEEEMET